MLLILVSITVVTVVRANLYQECAKFFNPSNYMDHLPSLRLPYMGNLPIPINTPKIKPSPVVKTKAVSIVTKYVYKNPVCVKYTKKKSLCKPDNSIKHKSNVDQLVTKEYFVRDRQNELEARSRRQKGVLDYKKKGKDDDVRGPRRQDFEDYNEDDDDDDDEKEEDYNDINLYVQSSKQPKPFSRDNRRTPHLDKKHIHDMLIEDRLDQLETVLPHYTRRRTYETSTITVTKVISNRRAMATLIVKNCVPQGYDFCSPKVRKRKSKVAQLTNKANESHYFG